MSEIDGAQIDAQIQSRLTALLYRNALPAQAVNVVAGGLVALLGYFSRPGAVIGLWWLALVAVSGLRIRQAQQYARRDAAHDDDPCWRATFRTGTLATAALWIVGGVSVMWGNDDGYRLLAGLAMAGMVAGAVPVLGAVQEVFLLYAVPMLAAVALVNFADGGTLVDRVFGVLSLVFLGGVVRSADFLHHTLVGAMTLDLEKEAIVAKLEQARAAAEGANMAKTQFLATMSHELRTPLAGMLGMAELLCEPQVSDAERREFAGVILSSGKTLLALLNDILDLSKVEAGKMEIAVADFSPSVLLEEVATLFGDAARRKGVEVAVRWDGDAGVHYLSDPIRVRQMLTNLISNAVKFTDRGSIVVSGSEVGRRGAVAELEFSVADTGAGIAPAKLELLFKPFSQVDNSNARRAGGTGLGLSIVRRIAELMGGTTGVDSEPGRGSRFWFRIRASRLAG